VKPVASRMRSAVKTHALDWITAALAATAVALFLLAMAKAAGAASEQSMEPSARPDGERWVEAQSAKLELERRLHQVSGDFGYYVESLERVFERDLASVEREVGAVIQDYEAGGSRRDFDRKLNALQVRLDQLSKRIDKMGTSMPLPRELRPY